MTFLAIIGFLAIFFAGVLVALLGIFGAVAHAGLTGTPAPWQVWATIAAGIAAVVVAIYLAPFRVALA